jgi:hypothetical protein
MNRRYFFSLVVSAVVLTIGCGTNNSNINESDNDLSDTLDLIELKKIINDHTNSFTQAHITGDTAFLNRIFAHDARIYPPNSDVVMGYDAITAVNLEWVNYGIKEFREESTRFYGNKELLIDEGTYYLRYGEENTIDKGKYINIWKMTNGEWKILSNIWNTGLPVAPAATD